MGHRAVLVLLFAISAVVSGSVQQSNSNPTSLNDISGIGELVGTWRLISRVVKLEDGTVVQDLTCPPKTVPV